MVRITGSRRIGSGINLKFTNLLKYKSFHQLYFIKYYRKIFKNIKHFDLFFKIWSIDNLDLLDQIPAAENDLISSISVTGDHLFTGAQSKNIKMWDLRF